MTPTQYLQILYPFLLNTADPRYVTEEAMAGYMLIAEGYRPSCLPDERQNEAQAHYVAYLADEVYRSTASGDTSIVSVPRVVKREKEYNVEVEYEYAQSITATTIVAPVSPYQSWQNLWRRCRAAGSITVSNAYPCIRNRDS